MPDRLRKNVSETIVGVSEVEIDLTMEDQRGTWIITGCGRSIDLEIPSLSAGWHMARDRQLMMHGRHLVDKLGTEVTVRLRGAPVTRLGKRGSGNFWGFLAGLRGIEVFPVGILKALFGTSNLG